VPRQANPSYTSVAQPPPPHKAQGQEKEIIILSLVRSNQEGIIGFLKDYRRMNVALTRAKEKLFVIGDSSKRIIDGQSGSTDEERDILRSVFGEYPPMGPIPPYIDHKGAGELKGGTDAMSCMFALHYFFENKEKLDKLLKNIRECIK
jgi:hypothetical protein